MTGRVHGPDEIVVGFTACYVAIDVAGAGHAGGNPRVGPVRLTAINVVARHGRAPLGSGRIPIQKNGMTLLTPTGHNPKEHDPDDPAQKDRQNRNRQA